MAQQDSYDRLALWSQLWNWLLSVFGIRPRYPNEFLVRWYGDRQKAVEAARRRGVIAVVGTKEKMKWALFLCPCGCGGEIALNLMKSHHPAWEFSVDDRGQGSLHPSVDATTCGAHFLLKAGKIIWCQ
jgi:hypothetical protein